MVDDFGRAAERKTPAKEMYMRVTDKRAAVDAIRAEFEKSRGTHIWKDYVNALRLVSQVVFTRSSGFVLEFIQNAEDAGQGLSGKGEVEISVSKHRLKFVHNGGPFDELNLRSICGIRSSKKPERGTLGYLGIGFKSVFKVADCAEVYSNGFQFKFDRNHSEWSTHEADSPWHVIPIWVEEPSEPINFENTSFIVRLRNEEAYEHLMEGLKAIRAELYLFLKWIKRISITDEVSGKTWTIEDMGVTPEGITTLRQDNKELRFKFFRREVTVPEHVKPDRLTQEYRANVTKREIAIAFALDANGNLDPSPSTAMYGGVYSFLPLGESKSGAKFPIQADFLVQPGRDSINAEAIWNHWLLEEVAALCRYAIEQFQKHGVWKYQYLAAFEFTWSKGYDAYDKLFGPKLIDPIEKLLEENPSVVTVNETWAKPSDIVVVGEPIEVILGLTEMGILQPDEIAPAFGGAPNLVLAHPNVAAVQPNRFKKLNRLNFLDNEEFLKNKAQQPEGSDWFRRLYCWLSKYPLYEEYFRRTRKKRVVGYHEKEIVLRVDNTLSAGGAASLLELGTDDPLLLDIALGLQEKKSMLHPAVLSGSRDDQERETLKGFLIGLVGVQKMDSRAVCVEAILPKITTSADKPDLNKLLTLTKYCQRHLQLGDLKDKMLWIVNKEGTVLKASNALLSVEFKPTENWETNKQYVPGVDFLSDEYINASATPEDIRGWREFLCSGGVKDRPDNGVEVFAVNYARDKLAQCFTKILPVEKLNHGYDMEAADAAGEKVYIEVKGLSSENNVELTGNEAATAHTYGIQYFLCVVCGIPATPALYLVRDPDKVGVRDKVSIRVADWKRERFDGTTLDADLLAKDG